MNFFLFLWVISALLGPHPDTETGTPLNPDPDTQHCKNGPRSASRTPMNMNHPILDDFNKILLTLNWSRVPPHTPALAALAALELAPLAALELAPLAALELAPLAALELAALRALQQVALWALQQEMAQRP